MGVYAIINNVINEHRANNFDRCLLCIAFKLIVLVTGKLALRYNASIVI